MFLSSMKGSRLSQMGPVTLWVGKGSKRLEKNQMSHCFFIYRHLAQFSKMEPIRGQDRAWMGTYVENRYNPKTSGKPIRFYGFIRYRGSKTVSILHLFSYSTDL